MTLRTALTVEIMSITYNPQGRISLEPTRGNLLGLTEIVLRYYERTLTELERNYPHYEPERLRAMARDWLEQHIDLVTETVHQACREAMMARPEDSLRRDLLGRILFHRLEHRFGDDPSDATSFYRGFVPAVLHAVRAIIGETQYDNLNEHSARPSLEYCTIHELSATKINWDDFYNQNLVNILLVRIRNLLRRWLSEPARDQRFMDLVNEHMDSVVFGPSHFTMLITAWGLVYGDEATADSG